MNNQMKGKSSKYLVAPKMQRKTMKREVRRTTSVNGRHMLKKNSKKQSKGSAKTRTFTSYEYEMKSCSTWEFVDVFQNIDNWHESLKGEDIEEQPVKIEQQMNDVKTVDEILVQLSPLESTNLGDDQRNRNAGTVDEEAVAMGGNTTTFNGTVMTHSTAARLSVNTQIDGEETFEETTENPRRTPRYLKRKSKNIEIIRKPAVCDNLEIRTLEDDMKVPGMLEQQELCNAAANNNNTNGVEIHTNDMQHMKNTVVQSTDPNGLNLTKKKQFKYSDLQKEFMCTEHLIVHQRIHSGEQSFKCTECPQVFSQKSHLTVHMRIHSGEKPYKCMQCPQVFSQKNNLIRHHHIHSGEKSLCTDCPQVFSQKQHLTTHMRIHSGEKSFKCTECSQVFSRKQHLTRHQRIHSGEKPFKCGHCPKKFSDNSNLKSHLRIHSGEKPFKCTECPQVFSQKEHLTRHQRIHSGEKPFKCTECPQAFAQKQHLTTHQRIHSGEKPFKCTECPQAFAQNSVLTRHQRIHSGEKPFLCPHCLKTFTRRSHMQKHILTHQTE